MNSFTSKDGTRVTRFIKLVGASDEDIAGIRRMPDWRLFEAIGHTLAYDAAVMGEDASVPTERAARVRAPALVMNRSESYAFMRDTALALARAILGAQHRTLEGQTHEAAAEVLAPVLIAFFSSNGASG
jgi:hypothetical protein